MNRPITFPVALLVVAVSLVGTGCQQQGVGGLATAQSDYYKALKADLAEARPLYVSGVTGLAEVEASRLAAQADWSARLRRGQVLLQSQGTPDKRTGLLLAQLGEMSLSDGTRLDTARAESAKHAAELAAAYDALVQSAGALQKNSQGLAEFLNDKSGKSALRSIDVPSLVRAVSVVRDVRKQIREHEMRTDEDRKKEDERLEKQIDQARDILVKIASRKPQE